MGAYLGFKLSAPTSRDLLLRRHFPNVASRRSGWPDMGPSRSENGWMWTDVAGVCDRWLPVWLPPKLVSRANVRTSRATCKPDARLRRQTNSLGLAGPLSALDASRQARLRGCDGRRGQDRHNRARSDSVTRNAVVVGGGGERGAQPTTLPSLAVLSHRIAIACGDDRTTVQYSRRWSRWTQRSTK